MNNLLLPADLQRLNNLELIARHVVEGFITGRHQSPFHGFSVEFAEHRQYMPGDSIRHVDWKVYGKTGRHYIKQYEEETNLKAWILLDSSKSMYYGSGEVTKFTYASWLAASLAYLLLRQQDAAGLMLFDHQIRQSLPPKSMRSYLHRLLEVIGNATPGTTTDLSGSLHQLAESIKRRGLIILISDLLDEDDALLSALKHFRYQQHEVIVFHIMDPREESFDFTRETRFRDMETGETLLTQPQQIRHDVQQAVQGFRNYFERECRSHLIDYTHMSTQTPLELALTRYLIKRRKLF